MLVMDDISFPDSGRVKQLYSGASITFAVHPTLLSTFQPHRGNFFAELKCYSNIRNEIYLHTLRL